MDEIVLLLDNGCYLTMWFSSNPAATEGCDACIGWNTYDLNKKEIDGGEMDYNDQKAGYKYIFDAITDVIEFVFEKQIDYTATGLLVEDFEE